MELLIVFILLASLAALAMCLGRDSREILQTEEQTLARHGVIWDDAILVRLPTDEAVRRPRSGA